jgi:hypothetical protein
MEGKSLSTVGANRLRFWRVACISAALAAACSPELWAATVSTYTFGRYEIVLQEGTPIAIGDIIGTVRRQTGLPEYPLVLGVQARRLELGILGPGNRPIRLASTAFTGPHGGGAASAQFIVERSAKQDDTLTLSVHQEKVTRRLSLAIDLQGLERLLEGPR